MEEKKIINVVIGRNIARLRNENQLTQKEVAEAIGITRSAYKQYENGFRNIPFSCLRELKKLYNVSSNYFFEDLPELSWKEKCEVYQIMESINSNPQKFIAIPLDLKKQLKKEIKVNEMKAQAKARIRLKKYREKNNKTQQDIANVLGVDLSTYNKYEKGSRKLNNDIIKKLADFYEISISDIID